MRGSRSLLNQEGESVLSYFPGPLGCGEWGGVLAGELWTGPWLPGKLSLEGELSSKQVAKYINM